MDLTMLLADSAGDTAHGKLSALGMGWTRIPEPVPGFTIIGFAVFTPDEAAEPHKLTITLCDLEGNPVMGTPEKEMVRIDAELHGQLADDLENYELVRIQFAVPIPGGMPVKPGGYEFQAVMDDANEPAARCRFRVTPSPVPRMEQAVA